MNLKELIKYGHKAREVREKYENPTGLYFRPDKCGDNIDNIANQVVLEKGFRKLLKAEKDFDLQDSGHGCGCGRCKDMISQQLDEALDETDWDYNQRGWQIPSELTVKKKPVRKKKRNRGWNGL